MAATLSLGSLGASALYGYSSDKIFQMLFNNVFKKEYERLDREAGPRVSNTYLNEEAKRLATEYVDGIREKADTVAIGIATLSSIVLYEFGKRYFSQEEQLGGRRKKNQRGGVEPSEPYLICVDFTNKDGTHHSFVFSTNNKFFFETNTSLRDILMEDEKIYEDIKETLIMKELNKTQMNAAFATKIPAMQTGRSIPSMGMPMGRMGMAYGGKRSKRRRSSKRRSKRSKRSKQTKRRRN
jgi:hypothetical protein